MILDTISRFALKRVLKLLFRSSNKLRTLDLNSLDCFLKSFLNLGFSFKGEKLKLI